MKHSSFLIYSALIFLASCEKAPNAWNPDMAVISEEPRLHMRADSLFLKEGETFKLDWSVTPEKYASRSHEMTWSSSDEDIVRIDEEGNVTAVQYGVAIVSARLKSYKTDSNGLLVYGILNREIPVYVSFSDKSIDNPEEMYNRWLGRWSLSGPAYTEALKYPWDHETQYYSDYKITISELEPMESFRLKGWEEFCYSRMTVTNAPVPGRPLNLIARFDKKTGALVFIQNKDDSFVQSPYWSHTASGYQGQYAPLDNQNEIVIGYARQYKEGEALVRGAYERSDRKWRYNLAMGFSNPEGSTIDEPMFFPARMYRLPDVNVQYLELSDHSLEMEVGKEHDLTIEWGPYYASDTTIRWSSSHPEVVSVADGHIKALSPGTADVTVSVGVKSATCSIIVKKPYIHFVFANLRGFLCDEWDTDGDGELSFEEAAAATSIGCPSHYAGGPLKQVNTFHEFQYFTAVKELQPNCLANIQLWEITIPANVRTIGDGALCPYDSWSRLKVTLLGTPPEIGIESFGDADRVNIWVPDEYYDLYLEEAQKEDSPWASYAARLLRISEKGHMIY